jgi:hypothetical protein
VPAPAAAAAAATASNSGPRAASSRQAVQGQPKACLSGFAANLPQRKVTLKAHQQHQSSYQR